MSEDDKSSKQFTLDGKKSTKLVNIRRYGREGVTKIDRSTIFGNPFVLKKDGGEYTREESVEEYEKWFYDKIETDEKFKKSVEDLQGEVMGCWCKPKECHGDVILNYINQEL